MKKFLSALAVTLGLLGPAAAQNAIVTNPIPILITTGNTYQLVNSGKKQSLTIQNNNLVDNCLLLIAGPWLAGDTTATSRTVNGASFTAAKASVLLTPGASYTRYYPYMPSDQILATCTTTADSLYADYQ